MSRRSGALMARLRDRAPRKGYSAKFYEPETERFDSEVLRDGVWTYSARGHIQDSWPRALADACPDLKLPAGIRINEKQTSLKMDELLRQDPDAPIRHFPGSQHTGPGRTGLGASGGKPTTTKEEVEAWMTAQEGNILVSSRGNGYVFTEGWGEGTEVWLIGQDGSAGAFGSVIRETDAAGQEWAVSELPGVGEVRYPMGYPVPLMSTGHRHPAWQITDWLIESGRVLEVPGLGESWKGVRFHPENRVEVFPADGGAPVTGGWRWTKAQLQVWLSDGASAVEHWRGPGEAAEHRRDGLDARHAQYRNLKAGLMVERRASFWRWLKVSGAQANGLSAGAVLDGQNELVAGGRSERTVGQSETKSGKASSDWRELEHGSRSLVSTTVVAVVFLIAELSNPSGPSGRSLVAGLAAWTIMAVTAFAGMCVLCRAGQAVFPDRSAEVGFALVMVAFALLWSGDPVAMSLAGWVALGALGASGFSDGQWIAAVSLRREVSPWRALRILLREDLHARRQCWRQLYWEDAR